MVRKQIIKRNIIITFIKFNFNFNFIITVCHSWPSYAFSKALVNLIRTLVLLGFMPNPGSESLLWDLLSYMAVRTATDSPFLKYSNHPGRFTQNEIP